MQIIKNAWDLVSKFVKDRIAWWKARGKEPS